MFSFPAADLDEWLTTDPNDCDDTEEPGDFEPDNFDGAREGDLS